ncbi:MAG TPA: D-aminoacyl-tRNA deacylase, partial [Pseudomonadales bacterium]|nr:D-aminoacyl-tRNA deacylase [Pseudomonadales bacterium]
PQFTLVADTRRGLRPSFSSAASPAQGRELFDLLLAQAAQLPCKVAAGRYGADMAVSLLNQGPVTFWLES